MARMGHDSERAAIIYQHAARGADQAITEAMDAHVEAQQTAGERGTMTLLACLCQQTNCTLIARTGLWVAVDRKSPPMLSALTLGFSVERVTGIEPALSAWEVCGASWPSPADRLTCGFSAHIRQ
jgi:hypothetical protein